VEPEYPAVVIPAMTQYYAMLQSNLLYTGVTRGKRLVVLVGQKKAIAIALGRFVACLKSRCSGKKVTRAAILGKRSPCSVNS
jgi:hypothetical protein